jgi:hypothetical protein
LEGKILPHQQISLLLLLDVKLSLPLLLGSQVFLTFSVRQIYNLRKIGNWLVNFVSALVECLETAFYKQKYTSGGDEELSDE